MPNSRTSALSHAPIEPHSYSTLDSASGNHFIESIGLTNTWRTARLARSVDTKS